MKKNIITAITTLFIILFIYNIYYINKTNNISSVKNEQLISVNYSSFIKKIHEKEFKSVTLKDDLIFGMEENGKTSYTHIPNDPHLIDDLINSNIPFSVKRTPPEKDSFLFSLFRSILPMLIFFALLMMVMNRGSSIIPKSDSGELSTVNNNVKLSDVAGLDSIKEEVYEIVDFIKQPEKFISSGAIMPKGILFTGPPGTGKTLLAKAIAGECNIPFISISGSEFVELFAGLGASRVRKLFKRARKHSPCIIFIDEIDAIGKKRGDSSLNSGESDREQTLNQILVEMDGFSPSDGVFVIAATNRSDVLDEALKRSGRFDREINVPLPDLNGRVDILKIHTKKINLAPEVNLLTVAKGLIGFSGADISNIVNEAAIISTRLNLPNVNQHCFNLALDRTLMGVERKGLIVSKKDKESTAYHEIGHSFLGSILPEHDPIHKVSIIPRGGALGAATFLPEGDEVSYSKRKLLSKITTLFGGRVVEELKYGKDMISTGASNDIERATIIAQKMVTEWGFSENLGVRRYFLEGNYIDDGKPSESVRKIIDEEIDQILSNCYEEAKKLINDNFEIIDILAKELMEKEELSGDYIMGLILKHNLEYSPS